MALIHRMLNAVLSEWPLLQQHCPNPEWLPCGLKPGSQYGCGSYGCVWPTNDPRVVFKATCDPREIEAIHKIGDTMDGFVHYYHSFKMNSFVLGKGALESTPVYGVWRESADPECLIPPYVVRSIDVLDQIGDAMWDFNQNGIVYFKEILDAMPLASEKYGSMFEIMPTGLRLKKEREMDCNIPYLAYLLRAYWLQCEALTAMDLTEAIGQSLLSLYREEIIFLDVRRDNIGCVIRDGEERIVIFDPGLNVDLNGDPYLAHVQ